MKVKGVYYNEHDTDAADWLERNFDGTVDCGSAIAQMTRSEMVQCYAHAQEHFDRLDDEMDANTH